MKHDTNLQSSRLDTGFDVLYWVLAIFLIFGCVIFPEQVVQGWTWILRLAGL